MRLLITVLLFGSFAFGQTTPNLHFNIPTPFSQVNTWGQLENANFASLDDYLSGTSTLPTLRVNNFFLPPQTAYTVWGNCGATFAAPGPCPLVAAMIPTISLSTGVSGVLTTANLPFTYTGLTLVLPTAGVFTGSTGALVCKDASGNLTTIGCSTAGGGAIVGSPGAGVNQSDNQASGTNLFVNRFEGWKFADGFTGGSTTGGIQEAINDCSSGQCIAWIPAGTTSACGITIPANTHVKGFGLGVSVISCGTANVPVIASLGTAAIIEDLTIQHSILPTCADAAHCGDGVSTGSSSADRQQIRNIESKNNWNDFRLGKVTFAVIQDVRAENCEGAGILFDATMGVSFPAMQWQVENGGLIEQCAGWGIDLSTSTTPVTAPTIRGAWNIFGNQSGGIRMQGSNTTNRVSDVDIEGVILSTNNGDNLLIDVYGRSANVDGGLNELAGQYAGPYGYALAHTATASGTGNGINITANCDPTGPVIIHNVKFWEDSNVGVLAGCAGTHVYGSTFFDMGYANAGTATLTAGVAIKASDVSVTGNWCGDGNGLMLSCVDISNSADTPSIVGNVCGAGISNAQCVTLTSTPTNGFQEWVGNTLYVQSTSAASGSCSGFPNGSTWIQTASSGGLWLCQSGTWTSH